jgi:hypothetical protein
MPSAMTRSRRRRRSSHRARGFLSERDDAWTFADLAACADGGSVGGTRIRAIRHHGSGEGVQSGKTGALACPEIQVAARDGKARDHPKIDNRATAKRRGPAAYRRAANWAGIAEFADGVGLGTRRRRDLSGSCGTLRSSGWRLWAGCGGPQHLYRHLHQPITTFICTLSEPAHLRVFLQVKV